MTENHFEAAGSGGEVSFYTLPRVILQYRYVILGLALLAGVVAAGVGYARPRTYTAETAFIPQGEERQPGGLTLATTLASALSVDALTQSPVFYARLLGSRQILSQVVVDTFAVAINPSRPDEIRNVTLPELFEIEANSEDALRESARRILRNSLSVTTDRGVVQLTVKTAWPDLSEAIASRLINLVEEFNVATRQSSAIAESRFLERRLADVEMRLHRAEDELRDFLEANRQFQNSPQLLFEHERLERRVEMHQQVFTGLIQSYELAQSAAARNTPLITVFEPAERPVRPDSRPIVLYTLLGMIFGGVVALVIALAQELLGNAQPDPEYSRFHREWMEARADLTRLRRRLLPVSTNGDREGKTLAP
jgi:uncharacterized protein involved in exopolysaccharide biosynthesis